MTKRTLATCRLIEHVHVPHIRRLLPRDEPLPKGWHIVHRVNHHLVYMDGELRKQYHNIRVFSPSIDANLGDLGNRFILSHGQQEVLNKGTDEGLKDLYKSLKREADKHARK